MIRPGVRRLFRLPTWRRDLREQELDEEVRLHLELRAEQLERQGMTTEAARVEARRRFDAGDESHQSLRRAARRRDARLKFREWLFGVTRDVRYVGRKMRRSPFFAAGVIGTLGLALGTAAVVGAVVWRIWLAPMPYPDPQNVVRLYEVQPLATTGGDPTSDSRRHGLSPGLLEDFRTHTWRTIEAVSEVSTGERRWTVDGQTRTVASAVMSPEGYRILGVVPILGRLPAETEQEVLLSEDFWRTELGGDPDIIGSGIPLGGRSPIVVGVGRAPAGYLGKPAILEVIDRRGDDDRSLRFLETIARVRPGYSVTDAQAEFSGFMAALASDQPEHSEWEIEAVVLADDLVRPFRGVLVLLLVASATFLLLATVNVLGLVAARGVDSRHDRVIRLALGASEGRLLRTSVIESLVLAAGAAGLGILGAYWLIGPLRATVPHEVPRLSNVAISPHLASAVLLVGVVIGALIGLAGYLISRRAEPSIGTDPARRGFSGGARQALVISQIALTTLFTASGVAILHRVSTLNAIDLGFEPRGLSSTEISGVRAAASEDEAAAIWAGMWRPILEGLQARGVPAALGFNTPMAGEDEAMGVTTLGIRPDDASEEVFYRAHVVSPGYFSTMRIELLAGRAFEHTDDGSARKVAIVSDVFARRYLPVGSPVQQIIGRQVEPVVTVRGPATVVGLVRSIRHVGPEAPVEPNVYVLFSQQPTVPPGKLLVRGDPAQVGSALSTVLRQVDPNLRRTPLKPYTSHLARWFAPLRLQLLMIGGVGILGLVLATLGVYSLMAYHVATRRRELGIRRALGARSRTLVRSILGGGASLTLIGGAIGLVGWYAALPWARGLVGGIEEGGVLIPIAAGLIVGGSCLLAILHPALKAARVDPAVILRTE